MKIQLLLHPLIVIKVFKQLRTIKHVFVRPELARFSLCVCESGSIFLVSCGRIEPLPSLY